MPRRRRGPRLSKVRRGLPYIYSLLGLSHLDKSPSDSTVAAPRDPVLVSIDFENPNALGKRTTDSSTLCAQMGVAMLDTRCLLDDISESSAPLPIQTFLFAAGCPQYCYKASQKNLFGEMINCKPSDFVAHLNALLPRDRSYVFIGHNVPQERCTPERLQFEPRARLAGLVDTVALSGEVFNTRNGLGTLRKTLDKLGCPHDNLHYAGNDAHFTLRAFLLLAKRGFEDQCPSPLPQDARILSSIQRVALVPVPRSIQFNPKGPPSAEKLADMKATETIRRAKSSFRAQVAEFEAEFEEQGYFAAACWPF